MGGKKTSGQVGNKRNVPACSCGSCNPETWPCYKSMGASCVGGSENKYPQPQEPPASAPPQPVPNGAVRAQKQHAHLYGSSLPLPQGRQDKTEQIKEFVLLFPLCFCSAASRYSTILVSHSIALAHSVHTLHMTHSTARCSMRKNSPLNIWVVNHIYTNMYIHNRHDIPWHEAGNRTDGNFLLIPCQPPDRSLSH